MKDRLIELKRQFAENFDCNNCQPVNDKCRKCLTEKEADYLLENGVIVSPCKVGEDVWCIVKDLNQVLEGHVRRITVLDGFINVYCGVRGYYEQVYTNEEFQDMVFLTKEEAEQALRKDDEGK